MQYKNLLLAIALCAGMQVHAQTESVEDSLGLPGDNFDLYGALDLFKASSSLEDFEKKLNEENNQVNNLDLDEDGNVDYIIVADNMDGDAHAIQLQVAVSETETQDVAAIEIEKTGAESADLQIVGDEELYGDDYIVEASAEEKTTGASDQKWQNFSPSVVFVNVWLWPGVRFIYAPGYVVWRSPYRWRYYPVYWHPWHPVAWHVHRARVVRYHHPHYHCVHVHRVGRAHAVYHSHRRTSATVHRRHEAAHQRRAANHNSPGKVSAPRDSGSGHSTGKQQGNKSGGKASPSKKGGGGSAKKSAGGGNGPKKAGGSPKKGGGGGKRR